MNGYDYLERAVSPSGSGEQRQIAIRAFAEELSWTPSYELKGRYGSSAAEYHLAVEHGLEQSAIITFLDAPCRAADLSAAEIRSLLTISYNNLIEWHIFVSQYDVRFENNLIGGAQLELFPVSRENYADVLSVRNFNTVRDRAPRRTRVKSCEDVFINLISRWKKLIKADYPEASSNEAISALLNAIIFSRGCEDYLRQSTDRMIPTISDFVRDSVSGNVNLGELIGNYLSKLDVPGDYSGILNFDKISTFSNFDRSTANELLRDFYRPSTGEYGLNFALMSKHALSRVYEKYVAILEVEEDAPSQMSFLPELPVEVPYRRAGVVYTPQFVAGFFARFIKENVTPRAFRSLRSIDPACGSGIFLRTMLEMQADPLSSGVSQESIRQAFANVTAVDRDANACEATRLSLALLHLVATGSLPAALDVKNADSIRAAVDGVLTSTSFDVVVANPPYIKHEQIDRSDLDLYRQYLGEAPIAKIDAYLVFMKLCLDLVRPGGFVCLVVPQVFLQAENAAETRRQISDEFEVRCLADLSAVRVFEGVGAYSLLLILERPHSPPGFRDPAQVAIVRELAGSALQACISRTRISNAYFDVFEVSQSFFGKSPWVLLPPKELSLSAKLARFKPISSYLNVRQGVVSGDNSTFIVSQTPAKERAAYVRFMPDREIEKYSSPVPVNSWMLYPTNGVRLLEAEEVAAKFPETWRYLLDRRERLEAPKSASRKGPGNWWRPLWPRKPEDILQPKIVCPHLMLTPRFSLDLRGDYLISHSPYLTCKASPDIAALKFFCAVLNSSVAQWWINRNAPKYGGGYNRLEVGMLGRLPVPNPAEVGSIRLNEITILVDEMIASPSDEVERRLDQAISQLYELSFDEFEMLSGRAADG